MNLRWRDFYKVAKEILESEPANEIALYRILPSTPTLKNAEFMERIGLSFLDLDEKYCCAITFEILEDPFLLDKTTPLVSKKSLEILWDQKTDGINPFNSEPCEKVIIAKEIAVEIKQYLMALAKDFYAYQEPIKEILRKIHANCAPIQFTQLLPNESVDSAFIIENQLEQKNLISALFAELQEVLQKFIKEIPIVLAKQHYDLKFEPISEEALVKVLKPYKELLEKTDQELAYLLNKDAQLNPKAQRKYHQSIAKFVTFGFTKLLPKFETKETKEVALPDGPRLG